MTSAFVSRSGESAFLLVRADSASAASELEDQLVALLPFVRGLVYRLLGPSPWLDDAVQDALIELAGALPRFEGRSSVRSYAGPIVVRVAYRYFERRAKEQRAQQLDEERMHADVPSPEAECIDADVVRRLYAHLEQLPAHHRAAFVLCDVEGLSPSEAARLLGVLPITLRAHLHRARRALRKLLETDSALRERLVRGER